MHGRPKASGHRRAEGLGRPSGIPSAQGPASPLGAAGPPRPRSPGCAALVSRSSRAEDGADAGTPWSGRAGPAEGPRRAALSSAVTRCTPPSPPSRCLLLAVGCEEAKRPQPGPGSAAPAPTLRSTSTTPGPRRPPLKGTAGPARSACTAAPTQRGPCPVHPGNRGPGAGCPERGCCAGGW